MNRGNAYLDEPIWSCFVRLRADGAKKSRLRSGGDWWVGESGAGGGAFIVGNGGLRYVTAAHGNALRTRGRGGSGRSSAFGPTSSLWNHLDALSSDSNVNSRPVPWWAFWARLSKEAQAAQLMKTTSKLKPSSRRPRLVQRTLYGPKTSGFEADAARGRVPGLRARGETTENSGRESGATPSRD